MPHVVTIIGRDKLEPSHTSALENVLRNEGAHLLRPDQLGDRALDYYINIDEFKIPELRASLQLWAQNQAIDFVVQEADDNRHNKRLFVFDMDSTLIQQEVIDVLASYAGVEKQVSEITERAMNGELNFAESLQQRARLLAGLPTTLYEEIKPQLKLSSGAELLCKVLKNKGVVTAVVSGGFLPFARHVQALLGLDYAFANVLEVAEHSHTLTGAIEGEIVTAATKAEKLRELAAEHEIDLELAVAVGDGSNDLRMMAAAGLGVAFNAKPIVQKEADAQINTHNLADILYILGMSDAQIHAAVSGQ